PRNALGHSCMGSATNTNRPVHGLDRIARGFGGTGRIAVGRGGGSAVRWDWFRALSSLGRLPLKVQQRAATGPLAPRRSAAVPRPCRRNQAARSAAEQLALDEVADE